MPEKKGVYKGEPTLITCTGVASPPLAQTSLAKEEDHQPDIALGLDQPDLLIVTVWQYILIAW